MVKGRILASEWMIFGGGIGRLNQRPDNSSGHTVLAGHGVCPFMFCLGLFAGLLKRVAGVEGGKRSARTFLWIFLLSGVVRSPPKVVPSRRKSANPTPGFHGIVVSRQMSRVAPSRFPFSRFLVIQRVAGLGGAHALARPERVCPTDPCRALQKRETPLILAAWQGHATVVEKLLAAGADTEATDVVSGERGQGF